MKAFLRGTSSLHPLPGRAIFAIGAASDNDLILGHTTVSRHHALIKPKGGRYEVADLNSTNGTVLNNRLLEGPAALHDGDKLKFGAVEFVFQQLRGSPLAASARDVATILIVAGGLGFASVLIAYHWLPHADHESSTISASPRRSAASPSPIGTSSSAPFAVGVNHRMVDVANRTREFLVYVPASLRPHVSAPLVIMLHGQGMSNDEVIGPTRWERLADVNGFIAAFPQGSDGNWDDGHSSRSNLDIEFISTIIDAISKAAQIDPRRIFVTGYSMGASMAYRLGAELSDRIAAIAPDSGQLWMPPQHLKKPVSLMYIIGTADDVNPIAGGNGRPPAEKALGLWRTMLRCPGTSSPSDGYAGPGIKALIWAPCDGDTAVALYQIDKLGHYWPMPSDGFDATSAIWWFFSHHPKPE